VRVSSRPHVRTCGGIQSSQGWNIGRPVHLGCGTWSMAA